MASACKATCTIVSDSGNNVWGHLALTQTDSGSNVQIEGTLSGLTPGKHGISVCVSGDLSQGSASCGPVFNPFGMYVCKYASFCLCERLLCGKNAQLDRLILIISFPHLMI